MSLVGQAPPCRQPDRRDQARFEALNRAGSGWEIVRETLKRPWSTGSDSLSRSRPTSPSCRRREPQPAVVTRPGCLSAGRAALWSAHRGCRANDEGYRSAFPARSSTIGRLRRTTRPSCAARRSSGSGVADDSLGTAVRRAAEAIGGGSREDAVGRSQQAARDNDVGFVLNRLRNLKAPTPTSAGGHACPRRRPLG